MRLKVATSSSVTRPLCQLIQVQRESYSTLCRCLMASAFRCVDDKNCQVGPVSFCLWLFCSRFLGSVDVLAFQCSRRVIESCLLAGRLYNLSFLVHQRGKSSCPNPFAQRRSLCIDSLWCLQAEAFDSGDSPPIANWLSIVQRPIAASERRFQQGDNQARSEIVMFQSIRLSMKDLLSKGMRSSSFSPVPA